VPVEFSSANRPAAEADQGHAFQLPPTAASVLLPQTRQITNRATNRNLFDGADFAEDLEGFHSTFLSRRLSPTAARAMGASVINHYLFPDKSKYIASASAIAVMLPGLVCIVAAKALNDFSASVR